MIDALYPIMGGMISKYVTQAIKEMMEKINEKIEQGLSVERYKRKIKAKLTGVSETELLLEESSDATIESILVIHKETGILIAEAHHKNSEIDDAHMVASMASAIKDFVNDWISNQEESENKEVQLLSYGDATLYIESAGSVYMIAFLDSEPDYEQRKQIHTFFAGVVKKYSDFFQRFEGDDTLPEIKKIETMLHTFLEQAYQEPSQKKHRSGHKNPAKIIFALLGLVGAISVGYWVKGYYIRHTLEQKITRTTGADIQLEEKNGKLYMKGEIEHFDTLYAVKSFLKNHTRQPIVNALYLPVEELDRKLLQQQQLIQTMKQTYQKDLSALKQTYQQEREQLKNIMEKEQQQLAQLSQQTVALQNRLDTVLKQQKYQQEKQEKRNRLLSLHTYLVSLLQEAFRSNSHYTLNPKTGTLIIQNQNLFQAGSSTPNTEVIRTLKNTIERYISTLMHDPMGKKYIKRFIVKGYTDRSGSKELNRKLSRERAQEVQKYILSLPVSRTYTLQNMLDAKGMASQHPVIINGVEDKEASRRIELTFELDSKKIAKEIEKLERE